MLNKDDSPPSLEKRSDGESTTQGVTGEVTRIFKRIYLLAIPTDEYWFNPNSVRINLIYG